VRWAASLVTFLTDSGELTAADQPASVIWLTFRYRYGPRRDAMAVQVPCGP
jgi:hypothetical protein